jgi:hypothetical protein
VLMGRLMVSLDVITAAIETPTRTPHAGPRCYMRRWTGGAQLLMLSRASGSARPLLGRPEGRGLPGAREGDRRADGSPATPREGW